jgi:3-deoxy-D-manno-octulosonic-acid transferase
MYLIYSVFIYSFCKTLRVLALFNYKVKKWITVRKNWEDQLTSKLILDNNYCWFHCASAGEFEQAIPLINNLRSTMYDVRIAVSFFSTSGYDMYKESKLADLFFYFPLDTKKNAEKLIKILNPSFAIFIRNEIWFNVLTSLNKKNIPTFLVNANLQAKEKLFLPTISK